MAYVIVFFAALVSGALVYWLTLRAGRREPYDASVERGGGFMPEPPEPGGYSYATSYAASMEDGRTYVPVATDRRSWQTRTVGVLGLVDRGDARRSAPGLLAVPGRLARGEVDQRLRVVAVADVIARLTSVAPAGTPSGSRPGAPACGPPR